MSDLVKNSGFVKDKIEKEHFVYGGGFVPNKVVLQGDGQWANFLPPFEPQSKGDLETTNCTSFNTLNCYEILSRRLFAVMNFSDRKLGIDAGTRPPGNSPHKVAEALRKNGLTIEDLLPFGEDLASVEEYYSYKGGDEVECVKNAQEWLASYDPKNEWVFEEDLPLDEKRKRLMSALRYSPLGISVCAWKQDGDLFVKDTFDKDNHWTCGVGFKINEFWLIYDSYPETDESKIQAMMEEFNVPREVAIGLKKLDWNYDFECAKVYFLFKRTESLKTNWLSDILKNIWGFVLSFFRR